MAGAEHVARNSPTRARTIWWLTVHHRVFPKGVGGQGRREVQVAVLDVRVAPVVCVVFKLSSVGGRVSNVRGVGTARL